MKENKIKEIIFSKGPRHKVHLVKNPTFEKVGNLLVDPKIIGIMFKYTNGKSFYTEGLFYKEWKKEQELTYERELSLKKEREEINEK